ncbi:MAG: YqaA family protein [Mariprofundaceae bacterium]
MLAGIDWSLFLSALASATLLPGGSEMLLLWRLQQGGDPLALVLSAGTGNVLGSLVTYGMGRLGNQALHRRWLRMDEASLGRAERWFARFGWPALLLAWMPVVGDPLCLVAGLLRAPVALFFVLVTAGKFARYAALVWLQA